MTRRMLHEALADEIARIFSKGVSLARGGGSRVRKRRVDRPQASSQSQAMLETLEPRLMLSGDLMVAHIQDQSHAAGNPLVIHTTFSDATPQQDYSAAVDWGDGTGNQRAFVFCDSRGESIWAAHAYASPGQYEVTLTLTGGEEQASESFEANITAASPGAAAQALQEALGLTDGEVSAVLTRGQTAANRQSGAAMSSMNEQTAAEGHPFTFYFGDLAGEHDDFVSQVVDWDDGTTTTDTTGASSLVHVYAQPGEYTPAVTASWSNDSDETITGHVVLTALWTAADSPQGVTTDEGQAAAMTGTFGVPTTYSATSDVSVASGDTLVAPRAILDSLDIAGGVQIYTSSPNDYDSEDYAGDNPTVSWLKQLVIANDDAALGERTYSGVLDLNNNDLVIDYTGSDNPIDDILDMARVACGSNGQAPDWSNTGLTSGFAIDSPLRYAIGVADNAQLRAHGTGYGSGYTEEGGDGYPKWMGTTAVPEDAVLVKFTWLGDINLDGFVDSTDYALINYFTDLQDPNLTGWQYGDFNYDEFVDTTDYALLGYSYDTGDPQWKGISATSTAPATYTVTVTATDANGNDIGTITQNDQAKTWSWSYTPADGPADGQTVTITATDSFGAIATTTFGLTVSNVAPSVTVTRTGEIPQLDEEGQALSFHGEFTDPGTSDTFTCVWSVMKDGVAYALPEGTATHDDDFSFTPGDNGTYVITCTVTDNDGGQGADSITVNVANAAPTDASATRIDQHGLVEGQAFTFSASASDPGGENDPLAYWWQVTNGETAVWSQFGQEMSFVADGDGIYDVELTVTDGDGGSVSTEISITVANSAPTVAVSAGQAVALGEAVTVSAVYSDAGRDRCEFSWSAMRNGQPVALSGVVTDQAVLSFTPDAAGTYTITATVCDGESAASATATVTVAFRAPESVAIVRSGYDDVYEGQTLPLTALVSGEAESVECTWAVRRALAGETAVQTGTGQTFNFHPQCNDDYTITVTAHNALGSVQGTYQVSVLNAAPVITGISAPPSSAEGDEFTLSVTATDAGTNDLLVTTWELLDGDGNQLSGGRVISSEPGGRFRVRHGSYTAIATVTDNEGLTARKSVEFNVGMPTNPDYKFELGGASTVEEESAYSLVLSPGSAFSYAPIEEWVVDWGDGTPLTRSPSANDLWHRYAAKTTYTISVKARTSWGTPYEATKSISVVPYSPDPVFDIVLHDSGILTGDGYLPGGTWLHNAVCVEVVDHAPAWDGIISVTVTWGDGDSDTFEHQEDYLTHVYDDVGQYTITATAEFATGQDDIEATHVIDGGERETTELTATVVAPLCTPRDLEATARYDHSDEDYPPHDYYNIDVSWKSNSAAGAYDGSYDGGYGVGLIQGGVTVGPDNIDVDGVIYTAYFTNIRAGTYALEVSAAANGIDSVSNVIENVALAGYGTQNFASGTSTYNFVFPQHAAPYAPSDVTATLASEDSVTLRWADNSYNEARFELGRESATTGLIEAIEGASVGPGQTSYTFSDQELTETQGYAVRAVNADDVASNWVGAYIGMFDVSAPDYVIANVADHDADGIADNADGANTDQSGKVNSDDVTTILLNGSLQIDASRCNIRDPYAATVKIEYGSAIRLWSDPLVGRAGFLGQAQCEGIARDESSLVVSGKEYRLAECGGGVIEGVSSDGVATITVTIDTDGQGTLLTKEVTVRTVAWGGVDIDSDNTSSGLPDASDAERAAATEAGSPGKVILANNGDKDRDGVIDCGDFANNDDHLTPMVIHLPVDLSEDELSELYFYVYYPGGSSPPAEADSNSADTGYAISDGPLRIWTKGTGTRDPASVKDDGDWVKPAYGRWMPGQTAPSIPMAWDGFYTADQLGCEDGKITLYVEGTYGTNGPVTITVGLCGPLYGSYTHVLDVADVKVTVVDDNGGGAMRGAVRTSDGAVVHTTTDLGVDAGGALLGPTRTYSTDMLASLRNTNGNGVFSVPAVFECTQGVIAVIGERTLYFDRLGDSGYYQMRYGNSARMIDVTGGGYRIDEQDGNVWVFNGCGQGVGEYARGGLVSRTTPGGAVLSVSYGGANGKIAGMSLTGGVSWTYQYNSDGLVGSIECYNGTTKVSTAEYQYYDAGSLNGDKGDLKSVVYRSGAGDVTGE